MSNLILTFSVGLLCGYIFYKTKIPGGMMVGAVIGVALFNIFSGIAYMPSYAKYTAQMIAGAYIGCSVEKDDLKRISKLAKPSLVLMLGMLLTNISVGFIIYFTSPLDLITSLMGGVPGGMSEIPIISADMGADMPKVTVLQFIRMLACIGLLPSIISRIGHNNYETEKSTVDIFPDKKQNASIKKFIFTITIAALCSIVGKLLAIPAGILLFSMLGTICLNLFSNKAYIPQWTKRLAQVLSGAFIGCNINYNSFLEMKYLIIPSLIIVTGYFLNCFAVGTILNKILKMPIKESFLAAMPAGASDMALISSDMGAYSTDLVVLQIVRLVIVISIFPQVIYFISHWFN